MITRNDSGPARLTDSDLLTLLPPGSNLEAIAYVATRDATRDIVLDFPEALHCYATRVGVDATADVHLKVLTVPRSMTALTEQEQSELLTPLRNWVEAASQTLPEPSQMMTLQGTLVVWAPGRVAILAAADRIPEVRKAVIEAAYYERELREIESQIGKAWPEMDADVPLAFESKDLTAKQRKQLRQRFESMIRFRARLTRIAAQIHVPHAHPPTLHSQVGERFRDRTRLAHRYEFLSDQIEVFEELYEKCSERSNEFRLTQSSNTLEWIIIILLVTQILLSGFELLTSMGT